MGINFSNGEITPTPHELHRAEYFKTPCEMVHGDEAYCEMDTWFADKNGTMWVNMNSPVYSAADTLELIDGDGTYITKEGVMINTGLPSLCRIICMELIDPETDQVIKGFIVDCADTDFTPDGSPDSKLTRTDDSYATIESAEMDSVLPVFGWIANAQELSEVRPILAKHGIVMEESALEMAEDTSDEDED